MPDPSPTVAAHSHRESVVIRRLLDRRFLLAAACGVGLPADDAVAESLVAAVHRRLNLSSPQPAVERRWRLEADDSAYASTGARRLCHAIARAEAAPGDLGSPDVVALALSELDGDPTETFGHLCDLLGDATPTLWVEVTTPAMADTVRWVVQAVERTTHGRLDVSVDLKTWPGLLSAVDAHTAALLQQGVAAIPPEAAGLTALRAALRRLALAASGRPADEPPAELEAAAAAARSLAEQFLYEALAADPRTAGLFELNAAANFDHGGRPAEIDLFCRGLGLAVEVDGYYHFQAPNAYRRDRRKDWLMQRHGLLVLRFLAEDVAERRDDVLLQVIEAVEYRRKLRQGDGDPNA